MRIVRIPTSYNLHRADSGRLSSGLDPTDLDKKKAKVQQVQNIPRKLRDCFVAEPGHCLVGADYRAIEWGVMEWYGKTPFHLDLLRKFRQREMDPHRLLASTFYSIPEALVTKRQRDVVKPYTYGYWESPIGVGRRVGHLDNVAKAVGVAHERAFHMNEIRKWMLDYVKRHKYAETALGFRRYFWEWKPKPEEVFAHFGQGTAADILKWILLRLSIDYPWEIITTTHDSVVTMPPEAKASEAASLLAAIMEQPIPWMDGLSWGVDVKVGQTWREVS